MKIVEFAFIVYPATDQARSRAFYEGTLDPDGNKLGIHQRNA